jgi:hypothetical protein
VLVVETEGGKEKDKQLRLESILHEEEEYQGNPARQRDLKNGLILAWQVALLPW